MIPKTGKVSTDNLKRIDAMKLGPEHAFALQLVLIVQDLVAANPESESGVPFQDWDLAQICECLKIKAAA